MRSKIRKSALVLAMIIASSSATLINEKINIVECGGDLDCFEKNPHIYSEYTKKFRGCARTGDICGVDIDGRIMIAVDLNSDGMIIGDIESGS